MQHISFLFRSNTEYGRDKLLYLRLIIMQASRLQGLVLFNEHSAIQLGVDPEMLSIMKTLHHYVSLRLSFVCWKIANSHLIESCFDRYIYMFIQN